MSFLAVLIALLLEQIKPLRNDNRLHSRLVAWVGWTGRNFDAGKARHVAVVWCISVGVPAVLAVLLYRLVLPLGAVAALALNVAVLYLTFGFRQFSHYFTDLRNAFERGDEDDARRVLGEWLHLDAGDLPRTELLRHAVEHALLAAHRHVFGVFFWFVVAAALGLGPAGAVLYRMAEFMARYWAYRQRALEAPSHRRLLDFSIRAFALIDHLPARLTAFGFAVVGNFEDAVNGWRRDAVLWQQPNEGIVLAAAAGAVGVQLGGAPAPDVSPDRSKGFSTGHAPNSAEASGCTPGQPLQLSHLHNVVGLVWRSVVLWMLLLALLTLAHVLA